LESLAAEVCRVIGDFLSAPNREDAEALDESRPRRWGPSGEELYHLLLPPRPDLHWWAERVQSQLAVEGAAAVVTLCCVVPRAAPAKRVGAAELRRAIPQVANCSTTTRWRCTCQR